MVIATERTSLPTNYQPPPIAESAMWAGLFAGIIEIKNSTVSAPCSPASPKATRAKRGATIPGTCYCVTGRGAGPRSPSGEGHCLIETVASQRSGPRGGEGPTAPWSPRRRGGRQPLTDRPVTRLSPWTRTVQDTRNSKPRSSRSPKRRQGAELPAGNIDHEYHLRTCALQLPGARSEWGSASGTDFLPIMCWPWLAVSARVGLSNFDTQALPPGRRMRRWGGSPGNTEV
jgi:hypothetical protein